MTAILKRAFVPQTLVQLFYVEHHVFDFNFKNRLTVGFVAKNCYDRVSDCHFLVNLLHPVENHIDLKLTSRVIYKNECILVSKILLHLSAQRLHSILLNTQVRYASNLRFRNQSTFQTL